MTLLERMMLIREVEDRLQKMCLAGEAGDLHFSKGQEAIAVGVCAGLFEKDHIVTHHRTIAHEIARLPPLLLGKLIGEVLGKKNGLNEGRAGEMHLSNPAIRHDFSFQLVGTCIPVAAGIAWALKNHHKKDEIVAVFFGDAATSNGQFHEGLTIAAVHKLPLLLICENNSLAGNIRPEHYLPVPTVGHRMGAYGIPAYTVDGNDVDEVRSCVASVRPLVARGPVLVEAMTTRLCFHKQGQGDARSKEELAELAQRDPIERLQRGDYSGGTIHASPSASKITDLVDHAFREALAAPDADP